jgi:hypothetical protein
VNRWLHAIVYIALIGWFLFEPDLDIGMVDGIAQQVADLGLALLALVPTFAGLVAPIVYDGVKGLPAVGYSHSG